MGAGDRPALGHVAATRGSLASHCQPRDSDGSGEDLIYTYLITNGKDATFTIEVTSVKRYHTLTALLNGGFAARLVEVKNAK